jgi:hypothetical protein
MNESELKTKLVAQIKALGGRGQRFEDKFAIGLLDLGIKFPGLPFVFAEAKLIIGNSFGPTPAQFISGKRWIEVGVPAILIGWKDKVMHVSDDWVEKAHIGGCSWSSSAQKQAEMLREFISDRQAVQDLRPLRRPGSPSARDLQAPKE